MKTIKAKLTFIALGLCTTGLFIACENRNQNEDSRTTESTEQTTAGYPSESETKDSAATTSNDATGYMSDMNSMMSRMEKMEMTGDFDVDFANMMIEHHRGAITMAEKELSNGKDQKVKDMARKLMEKQKAEMEKLEAFVKKNPAKKQSGTQEKHDEMHTSMTKMKQEMKGMKMTGDADKDFVAMMIPHHEASIEMAKNELSHGDAVEMKQMAQKLINDQKKELKELEALQQQK